MHFPRIITNFKAYDSGFGDDALRMAKIHEKVSKATGVLIGIAVPAIDIRLISESVSIPVFAQHIDYLKAGKGTGNVLPEAVKHAGAFGTLLNHSEKRLGREAVKLSIDRAREVGLKTLLCVESSEEAGIFNDAGADFVAVEPPELIGGDISVSTASPEIIDRSVKIVGHKRLFVGAGIKDKQDVLIACELGAFGVLVASGIMQSSDPENSLFELVQGILEADKNDY